MNGKIFTAYHFIPEPSLYRTPDDLNRPFVGRYRNDDLYQPVVMGLEIGDRPDLLSDLHGDAPHYAPLPVKDFTDECVKWYVWKNLLPKYDWIGFQQYRRQLDFGQRSNDEIRSLVEQYDIIVPGPDVTTGENPNMREMFIANWCASPWNTFEKLMGPGWNFTMPLKHPHQSWIMRADEFDRYMTKWRDVFLELTKTVIPGPRTGFDLRGHHIPPKVYGYLTERFATLYVDRVTRERPDTKVLVLPGIQPPGWRNSDEARDERTRRRSP